MSQALRTPLILVGVFPGASIVPAQRRSCFGSLNLPSGQPSSTMNDGPGPLAATPSGLAGGRVVRRATHPAGPIISPMQARIS